MRRKIFFYKIGNIWPFEPYYFAKDYRNSKKIKNIRMKLTLSYKYRQFRDLLEKCAATAMSSKLIHSHKDFFKNMVVDAVLHLDQIDLNEKLIGIKKVPGGAMQDSLFIDGVAFKKTFSYAGFEQQPKCFENPKILCLNVELELKAEKDNAEVRIEQVSVSPFIPWPLRRIGC